MMGQLLKRQNDEIKRKENKRQPVQQRVLYKEFSRPVRAANYLENRLMLERVAKAAQLSKRNQFRYDREVDDIHQLEKTLTIKSIDFNGEEFHKIHEKHCRSRDIRIPTVSDILNKIPSNAVLEFGPGNQIVEKRPKSRKHVFHPNKNVDERYALGFDKNLVQSKYAKYFRSKSASPSSTRERAVCQHRPMTSRGHTSQRAEIASQRAEIMEKLTLHGQPLMRLTTKMTDIRPVSTVPQNRFKESLDPSSIQNKCDSLENEDEEEEYKSKSYRTLKEMYTYKEEDEKPVIDKKLESLKKMKTKERITFQYLDNRVRAFTKKLCKSKN